MATTAHNPILPSPAICPPAGTPHFRRVGFGPPAVQLREIDAPCPQPGGDRSGTGQVSHRPAALPKDSVDNLLRDLSFAPGHNEALWSRLILPHAVHFDQFQHLDNVGRYAELRHYPDGRRVLPRVVLA